MWSDDGEISFRSINDGKHIRCEHIRKNILKMYYACTMMQKLHFSKWSLTKISCLIKVRKTNQVHKLSGEERSDALNKVYFAVEELNIL